MQAKTKIEELQDQERHMTEVLTSYDTAISSSDASTLSEAALMELNPLFNDPQYMKVGPSTPKDALSPLVSFKFGSIKVEQLKTIFLLSYKGRATIVKSLNE